MLVKWLVKKTESIKKKVYSTQDLSVRMDEENSGWKQYFRAGIGVGWMVTVRTAIAEMDQFEKNRGKDKSPIWKKQWKITVTTTTKSAMLHNKLQKNENWIAFKNEWLRTNKTTK